jgi:hypothetical protein
VHALADIRQRAAHLLSTEKSTALTRAIGLEHLGVTYDVRGPNMLRYASLVLLRTLIFEEFTGLVLTHGSGCPVREPSPITWK